MGKILCLGVAGVSPRKLDILGGMEGKKTFAVGLFVQGSIWPRPLVNEMGGC